MLDVSDYYADAAETEFLKSQGETDGSIGQHAGIADTAELMSVHPEASMSAATPTPLTRWSRPASPAIR